MNAFLRNRLTCTVAGLKDRTPFFPYIFCTQCLSMETVSLHANTPCHCHAHVMVLRPENRSSHHQSNNKGTH
jgi:hypothetical protein